MLFLKSSWEAVNTLKWDLKFKNVQNILMLRFYFKVEKLCLQYSLYAQSS